MGGLYYRELWSLLQRIINGRSLLQGIMVFITENYQWEVFITGNNGLYYRELSMGGLSYRELSMGGTFTDKYGLCYGEQPMGVFFIGNYQ